MSLCLSPSTGQGRNIWIAQRQVGNKMSPASESHRPSSPQPTAKWMNVNYNGLFLLGQPPKWVVLEKEHGGGWWIWLRMWCSPVLERTQDAPDSHNNLVVWMVALFFLSFLFSYCHFFVSSSNGCTMNFIVLGWTGGFAFHYNHRCKSKFWQECTI